MEISFISVLIYEITVKIQVVQVLSYFLANTVYNYKINLIISLKIKIFSKNY